MSRNLKLLIAVVLLGALVGIAVLFAAESTRARR